MEQGTIYDISPITKTKTIVYTKMEVKVLRINFGSNTAEIEVNVYDDSRENQKVFIYVIDGTNYLEWTTDNYLTNWIKNKLRDEVF